MVTSDLSGVRIIVTRAQHQAGSLARMLRNRDAEVEEIPTIEIRPPADSSALDSALRRLSEYDWLILTSVNGVEALFCRAEQLSVNVGLLHNIQICAIGPATRRTIEKRGFKVVVVPRQYIAESVVEALRAKVQGKRVLLVRAKEARDVIPRELQKAGAAVTVAAAYETVVPEGARERLVAALTSGQKPNVITFTSSSTARHLISLLGGADAARRQLSGIALASIGPVTSATLQEAGLQPSIEATDFTMPGVVDAITRWRKKVV